MIKRPVKLPHFRILQLTFQRVTGSSEKLGLEDAYSERDRIKARQSSVSFSGGAQWEIPSATSAFRDGQDGESRSITTTKGARFRFANTEYVVVDIRPDAIKVSPAGSKEKVETWIRRDLPPESP